mmetsp:Transcript_28661/g.25371  ORF Transcript_28661/g.25371 Transcript_28661/m.25371 type:complete len:146 (+) Transcript_28661:814-1251(+)
MEKNNKNLTAHNQIQDSVNQICYDSKGNSDLYWVFIFAKRLSKLENDKMDVLDGVQKTQKVQEDHMNSIRQTFADKSSLRLTSVKDKTSQSINYGEVKSILVSPFRAGGEARVDSRFVDLNIRNKNSTMSRIKNSSSFSKLPVYD